MGRQHGTPHPYDIHVPVLFYGAGIGRVESEDDAAPIDIAPTLARITGVALPTATGHVLESALTPSEKSARALNRCTIPNAQSQSAAPSTDRSAILRVETSNARFRRALTALLITGLAAAPSARATLSAQAQDQCAAPRPSATPVPAATRLPHAVVAAATSVDAVGAFDGPASRACCDDGRLDIGRVDEDTMLPDRTHERLVQRYNGLPVFGAQVVRQLSGSTVDETVFAHRLRRCLGTDNGLGQCGAGGCRCSRGREPASPRGTGTGAWDPALRRRLPARVAC